MPGKSSGLCEFFSKEPRQPPRPATPEEPGIHASGAGAKGELPICSKTGKGFRAAGSGGMHPGGNAGRKQHAQGTCHLKRKARIKPQGKFFLPHQADKDEQGSQQQPGSRNIVFIGHAPPEIPEQPQRQTFPSYCFFRNLPFSRIPRLPANRGTDTESPARRRRPRNSWWLRRASKS